MSAKGMIHFYYGYGKGKTTAALGLAMRASGCGRKVLIVQFLKGRETGELCRLETMPGVDILRGQVVNKFAFAMNEEQRAETLALHNSYLRKAIDQMDGCDLLVLDEVVDAYQLDLVDHELLQNLVKNKPEHLELVLTGHKPEDWLIEQADYVTEMVKHKHPFDDGVAAREGIEF